MATPWHPSVVGPGLSLCEHLFTYIPSGRKQKHAPRSKTTGSGSPTWDAIGGVALDGTRYGTVRRWGRWATIGSVGGVLASLQQARNGGRGAAIPFSRAVIVSITPSFPATMSLTSTGNIKSQLTAALGDKGPPYFSTFQLYLKASISRQEFEDQVRECLDTPHLRASSRR